MTTYIIRPFGGILPFSILLVAPMPTTNLQVHVNSGATETHVNSGKNEVHVHSGQMEIEIK